MTTNNNEIASTTLNHFPHGTEVEVSSDEEGFKGAWFRATIIANNDLSSSSPSSASNTSNPNPSSTNSTRRRKILVEYRNLVTEDGSEQLREQVDLSHVRPLPPAVGCLSFEVGDIVDADYRDGWWSGVVKKALGNSKFRVFFDNPPDLIEFHQNQMRVHQDWIDSHWIRPKREPQMTGSHFSPGTDVEVNLENDDSDNVWIPAIVVKENKDNTFLVKYHNPKPKHWGHTVDFLHIRPPAPRYADKTYKLHDKVDAFHDSAWWAGEISKVLPGKTYIATFKNGLKSKELSHAEIRPRGEWKGGKWQIKAKEAMDTSNSKMTTDDLEPALKKSKNAETASQLESPPDAVDDKLEKKALRRTSSGKSLTTQSTDKKGELVSSAQAPDPDPKPNVNETTPPARPNRVGRGRRSKMFKDGISTLSDTTTQVKKESLGTLFTTSATERLTRTRKPVIPFKFENYKRSRRQSDDAAIVLQSAPPKRIGRPKKSEVISPPKPAVDKIQSASAGATKKSVDKKGYKNKAELPSKIAIPSEGTNDLPAKVSSQFLKEELQTLTIDPKQTSNELDEGDHMEVKQPEAGGRRINKRKRGRPRKLVVLGLEASDEDNQPDGACPVQEVVQKPCPANEVALPPHGRIVETPELLETYRRKRADVSTTKDTANETGTVSGRQNNSLDDDDRPLSTWIGAIQSQPGTEAKSLGKNSDQRNGNKDQADTAKEAVTCNKGLPEENQRLPFTKMSPVWKVVESMEIFREMPQTPHFRPLYKCKEECREGLAIGHMVTFSSVVEKISKLRIEDRGSSFTSTLESLVDLENHGFNVLALRDRVNELLSIKEKLEPVRKEAKDTETKITEHNDNKTKLAAEFKDVDKKISELKEMRESIRVQIEMKDLEVERLQQNLDVNYGNISNLRLDFERLSVAPLKLT